MPRVAELLERRKVKTRPSAEVVAQILADGSVRLVKRAASPGTKNLGLVSGPDWTLWWQRRDWTAARD